jgi:hypothetical protein
LSTGQKIFEFKYLFSLLNETILILSSEVPFINTVLLLLGDGNLIVEEINEIFGFSFLYEDIIFFVSQLSI